ncbi:type IV toxin-antitoxin system AbiEi family antitoxin domain-containing protein [Serratia marcescens]|uniref:type IV toxin-antitoxin system AbiEi family antitoxin domain-containing protein n=1 Tax=Serratia TaxID=613 RepID=UPI003325ED56
MNIQSRIEEYVARLEPGKIFTYQDLPAYEVSPASTIKTIGRLVKSGQIRRFTKGNFYRPKQGVLGEMRPADSEKINTLLFSGGKRLGYITGLSLYNRMGLTTQVPKTVTIATSRSRQKKNFGNIDVKLVPAKAPITEKNKELLEILDAITDIKIIPDSRPSETLRRLNDKLTCLESNSVNKLINLAKEYYPPATRALLGFMLNSVGMSDNNELLKTLNPTTRYKIGLNGFFPKAKEWKIE